MKYSGVWMRVGVPRTAWVCHFTILFSPRKTHPNPPLSRPQLGQQKAPRLTNYIASIPILVFKIGDVYGGPFVCSGVWRGGEEGVNASSPKGCPGP